MSTVRHLCLRRPPSSPLFPYTTLFRSRSAPIARDESADRAELHAAFSRPPPQWPGRSAPASRAPPETRAPAASRSEEHTSELQSQSNLVCRLLLEKKKDTAEILAPRAT